MPHLRLKNKLIKNPSVDRSDLSAKIAEPWQNFRRDMSSSLMMVHIICAVIPLFVMPDLYTRPIALILGEPIAVSDISIDSYVTLRGRRIDLMHAKIIEGSPVGQYVDLPFDFSTFMSRGLAPQALNKIPAHVTPGWPAFSCLSDDFGLFKSHAKILLAFYFGLWMLVLPLSYYRHVWKPTRRD